MVLTLGQAAKEVGLSKPGVLKAIKEGKISVQKNAHGHWQIEPAELFRVYPLCKPVNANPVQEFTPVNHSNSIKVKELTHEVNLLSERLADRERRIEELAADRSELKQDREHWRQQAERLLLAPPTIQPLKSKKRFKLLWMVLITLLVTVGLIITFIKKPLELLNRWRISPLLTNNLYDQPVFFNQIK